ncbi:hypothetical protein [Candidatus Fokinia crypta]|uniref:Uncharacterized protein n=1 Tax=Candidatus Fokinia crypta TaxID=1920990 RepID=A0ABZ0UQV9_9RICK|nr:hypothetical protein [Candidatus Fokinia cryptica]WPX98089.1 hypothetical protein Fokcrypt_00622 [Candidatus Fokinia cryptica]
MKLQIIECLRDIRKKYEGYNLCFISDYPIDSDELFHTIATQKLLYCNSVSFISCYDFLSDVKTKVLSNTYEIHYQKISLILNSSNTTPIISIQDAILATALYHVLHNLVYTSNNAYSKLALYENNDEFKTFIETICDIQNVDSPWKRLKSIENCIIVTVEPINDKCLLKKFSKYHIKSEPINELKHQNIESIPFENLEYEQLNEKHLYVISNDARYINLIIAKLYQNPPIPSYEQPTFFETLNKMSYILSSLEKNECLHSKLTAILFASNIHKSLILKLLNIIQKKDFSSITDITNFLQNDATLAEEFDIQRVVKITEIIARLYDSLENELIETFNTTLQLANALNENDTISFKSYRPIVKMLSIISQFIDCKLIKLQEFINILRIVNTPTIIHYKNISFFSIYYFLKIANIDKDSIIYFPLNKNTETAQSSTEKSNIAQLILNKAHQNKCIIDESSTAPHSSQETHIKTRNAFRLKTPSFLSPNTFFDLVYYPENYYLRLYSNKNVELSSHSLNRKKLEKVCESSLFDENLNKEKKELINFLELHIPQISENIKSYNTEILHNNHNIKLQAKISELTVQDNKVKFTHFSKSQPLFLNKNSYASENYKENCDYKLLLKVVVGYSNQLGAELDDIVIVKSFSIKNSINKYYIKNDEVYLSYRKSLEVLKNVLIFYEDKELNLDYERYIKYFLFHRRTRKW